MNKELIKLIRIIQKQVVSILLVRGLVALIDKNGSYSFSNIRITKQGINDMGKEELISDEQVDFYRNIWPRGYKGSFQSCKEKIIRFMIENNCNFDQICSSAEKWLKEKETPYHGNADYFLYKNNNGTEISRCEEYLEEDEKPINNFRNKSIN